MKKVFICLILLLSFSLLGCSDNIETKSTESFEDKSFDLPAEVIEKIELYLFFKYNQNTDREEPLTMNSPIVVNGYDKPIKLVVPYEHTFEDDIDVLVEGANLCMMNFTSENCYYVCLYKSKSEDSGEIKSIWRGFNNEKDILELYGGVKQYLTFQINKASSIINLLSGEKVEAPFEYLLEYQPIFENNNSNTAGKIELNFTMVTTCFINDYLLCSVKESPFPYKIIESNVNLIVEIGYIPYGNSSIDYEHLYEKSIERFGKYHTYLIEIFKQNSFVKVENNWNVLYGLLPVEELQKIVEKIYQE